MRSLRFDRVLQTLESKSLAARRGARPSNLCLRVSAAKRCSTEQPASFAVAESPLRLPGADRASGTPGGAEAESIDVLDPIPSFATDEALLVATSSRTPNGSVAGKKHLINGRHVAGSSKVRVAVDIDEVLGCFLKTLTLFCEEEYKIFHELEEFFIYDFKQIWKCSQEEANHRVHEFFRSHHFNKGIPTIPGASAALRRLRPYCDFVVVTSRQHVIQEPTLQWIERHYPGLFSEVHFGNHFALEGKAKPKAQICQEIGATVLIDDNPGYAMECANHGLKVLLFDWELAYAWSKTKDGPTHTLITRVRDWREVEEQLLLLVRS